VRLIESDQRLLRRDAMGFGKHRLLGSSNTVSSTLQITEAGFGKTLTIIKQDT
jgi:hypothetical protein